MLLFGHVSNIADSSEPWIDVLDMSTCLSREDIAVMVSQQFLGRTRAHLLGNKSETALVGMSQESAMQLWPDQGTGAACFTPGQEQ